MATRRDPTISPRKSARGSRRPASPSRRSDRPDMDVALPRTGGLELLTWWQEADARAHHSFVAASLGWMLDSFDVMLYSIVLAALLNDPSLQLTKGTAGIL